MTPKNKTLSMIVVTALLLGSLSAIFMSPATAASLPQTGALTAPIAAPAAAGKLTAVKVEAPGLFSFSVEQSGNNVPSGYNVVGQYATAAKKNALGFLGHNYLAGSLFSYLKVGQQIIVTFSDGSTKTYEVYSVQSYQATDPNDFSQPFINSNGKRVTARQVFNAAYKANQVTFQTCIYKDGHSSWGVLFVIAKLVK